MTHPETIPGGIKILMVDDDKKLCRLVADYLEPVEVPTRLQLVNRMAIWTAVALQVYSLIKSVKKRKYKPMAPKGGAVAVGSIWAE